MLSESKTLLVHTSPMIMCELSVFIFKLSMQILSVGHERTSEKVYEQIIANKISLRSDCGFIYSENKDLCSNLFDCCLMLRYVLQSLLKWIVEC